MKKSKAKSKNKKVAKWKVKNKNSYMSIIIIVMMISILAILLMLFSQLCSNKKTVLANGITKIEKDLYYLEYSDEYDFDAMNEYLNEKYMDNSYLKYYKNLTNKSASGCSGARSGQYVGRTLDWYYVDSPLVVVKTTSTENRLASIAAHHGGVKTTEQVENDEISSIYPLVVTDGINEAGVSVQQNIVPLGYEVSEGSKEDGKTLNALLVSRYVLDNAHSVDEAIELLKNVKIQCSYSEQLTEEYHFLISDLTKSVVVEIINNEIVATEDNVMTNFYQNEKYFDGNIESLKTLQPTAMGWRRYKLLKNLVETENVKSVKDMFNLMTNVYYGKAYDFTIEDFWYDEGYADWDTDGDGVYDLTNFNMNTETEENKAKYRTLVENLGHMEEYNNGSWFTSHLAIFDLKNKTFTAAVDEQDYSHAHTFSFKK